MVKTDTSTALASLQRRKTLDQLPPYPVSYKEMHYSHLKRRALRLALKLGLMPFLKPMLDMAHEKRILQLQLNCAQRFSYGSLLPGIREWEEKWKSSQGRRVLFYAFKDYSGSLMEWARAVNKHTDFAARLAVLLPHQYEYPLDLLFPLSDSTESDFSKLVNEASVVHVKDESALFTGKTPAVSSILLRRTKPTVFTHYGGFARLQQARRAYQRYVLSFDARVATTPDLCYEWFDGQYIPHAIDSERYCYSWSDGKILGHSPSTMARKGTRDLLGAITGLDIGIELIHGVSHQECLARKASCNFFFDQAGQERQTWVGKRHVIGWYGNSALEASVRGIPTIAHLSDNAFLGALRGGAAEVRDCPIINTPLGPRAIRETILHYLAMPAREKEALSLDTRRWVEEFHSYPAVARKLTALYEQLLGRSP